MTVQPGAKTQRRRNLARREAITFYLCISPWLIGLVLFVLGPMIASAFFSLTRWDSMSLLVEWKPALPLKSGPNQTNRVGVMAKGTELTLYINGEQVDKINNDRYVEGLFGFYIATFNTVPFYVLVDEVAYWNQ